MDGRARLDRSSNMMVAFVNIGQEPPDELKLDED